MFFISPWVVGFLAFVLYPMGASLYYSLTDYNIISPPRFLGLDNYRQLLGDDYFRSSLYNTGVLVVFGVPAQLLVGFLTALLLNFKVRGQALFRTIFVLPSIMPTVALTILFIWILNPNLGAVNLLLQNIGITGPDWLGDPSWSKPSMIIMQLWGIGAVTIIYLAGLQGIPQDLYEVAELDGASSWGKLRYVTIPLISGVTLFNLVTGVIWAFQFFAQAYIVGGGGGGNAATGAPEGSLLFYAVYLFSNAFGYLRMGYASAMPWILFAIILALTAFLLLVSRKWVYYEDTR
jgi:multiple sugar transport system permease protein